MALLLVEGFEGFGTTTGVVPQPTGVVGRLYSVGYENGMRIRAGRLGGYSIEFRRYDCDIRANFSTTNDTLITGLAIKFFDNHADPRFMVFYDVADYGMNLKLMHNGKIQVRRGTTVLETTVDALASNTWYFIEFKVKCHNTEGTYELRVGGVDVASDSNVDTRTGDHDYYNGAKIDYYDGSTHHMYFDDWYVCDGSGSTNNDFLGNCRVVAVLPNSDDTAGWDTASGGSDHYLDVDENPMDDDTSYVEDATSGHKDLYDYAAMTTGLGAIKGLSIKMTCRETDATNFSLIIPIKSGATESDDSAQSIGSTNYVTKTRVSETNPNTSSAWTETTVNAAKFGVKVG